MIPTRVRSGARAPAAAAAAAAPLWRLAPRRAPPRGAAAAPARAGAHVAELATEAEFEAFIAAHPLAVVDFWSTTCGPCKLIAPKVEALAGELSPRGLRFGSLNVSGVEKNWVRGKGIKVLPTFHAYKGGVKASEMTGARIEALRRMCFFLI
jgi:thioredoxin 1